MSKIAPKSSGESPLPNTSVTLDPNVQLNSSAALSRAAVARVFKENEVTVLERGLRAEEAEAAEQSDGAVQVKFSSEFPGEQLCDAAHARMGIAKEGELYWEVLSHEPGDVDLSQLNNRGAFLDEHLPARHLGAVRSAALSADKCGRAVVEFDRVSKLSKVREKQMKGGSRPHISYGYRHTKYLGAEPQADGRTFHRFAWAGKEISSVANPMDPTAGYQRNADAQKRGKNPHCLGCGTEFSKDLLDMDGFCATCADSVTEATNEDEGNDGRVSLAGLKRFALPAVDLTRKFRAKVKGEAKEFSHADLRAKVSKAADSDKRFKRKMPNGNVYSDFHVHDVMQSADGDMRAIICGPEYTFYSVPFSMNDDGSVALSEEVAEVTPQQSWEPVQREAGLNQERIDFNADGLVRDDKKPYGDVAYADPGYQADKKKRYPVDTKAHAKAAWSYINQKGNADKYSGGDLAKVKEKIEAACKKFGVEILGESGRGVDSFLILKRAGQESGSNNKNSNSNFMGAENTTKTLPELTVDDMLTPHVAERAAQAGYVLRKTVDKDSAERAEALKVRNTELKALGDEFVKEYGDRIGYDMKDGKRHNPFYLRDRIQVVLLEHQADADPKRTAAEVRMSFRSKIDDLKRDSVPARNAVRAFQDVDSLGRECDLFGAIRKALDDAQKKGHRSAALMPIDGPEKEANDELRKQLADIPGNRAILDSGGIILPRNARSCISRKTGRPVERAGGGLQTRDALAGDFSTGGAFVEPEFMPYIDLLRNRIAAAAAGATFLGGLTGDVVFPRAEASTVAQSVAEGGQLAAYDQVLGQIKMSPHRVGSRQYYSRLAMLQATPDFEAFVWNDHSKVMALYIDNMSFNGTGGADQPVGLLNQPGINLSIFGGTPTYAQIVAFRTAIRKFNVEGPLSFLTTSVGQGRLAVLPETLVGSTVVSGATNAIWHGDELDGEVLGAKAIATQQIPNDILLAGVFENLMIGSWGGIVSVVDNYTRADRDEVALTLNTYFDVTVRHAQAFTRSMDSVNQ